ncbi:fructosamine kinase family protein [Halioglobus maricola]|uniref:Fructosamine kinase family protein n=1 Tax=Halioglobus maricola TaxID=2601894 RepID=A0A5P9NP56_9GAMM|nr:fructosamine kinase family protein [Halioglobus maricola]QFU77276.1 fructosamine kinase family protein [Halioglobus maricola]
MRDWQGISEAISAAIGRPFSARRGRALGGGCINQAVCLEGDGIRFFVKLNEKALLPMFEAEAAGLSAIADSGTIRVPTPIATGIEVGRAWLALEHIDLYSGNSRSSTLLGEQLAALHRSSAHSFGWGRDNTIGTTDQVNTRSTDWVSFYREHRLGHQLRLATTNGASSGLIDAGQRLMDRLPHFFESYKPPPALLHGDLWSGNTGADDTGAPVLFDPAVYYGDREADLAMTELFGGFDDRFYHSYRSTWDIDPGYSTRKVLYNLYHVLNHFNLFGGAYARQAEEMVARLLAET